MTADPYSILGVSRNASAADIKSAYRKLAKKLHPDMNPGRKDIEQQFKTVTAAYDLLSDPDKRTRFDRGEIDGDGNERGFGGNRTGGTRRSSRGGGPFGFGGGVNPEDIFAEFFGGRGNNGARGYDAYEQQRGADVSYEIIVPFTEACLGGKKRITLAGSKTVDITIPQGTEEGHKLRLRGLGQHARADAGDALIVIKIAPHPTFTREGQNIHLEVPISLPEAILGGAITVPTLDGSVALKIHKGANSGTMMRLKGKGVPSATGPSGDMFVKLKIMLPDGDLSELEKWAQKNEYNPRKKLGWA